MPLHPHEEQEYQQLLQDPDLSDGAKMEVLQILEPALKDLTPEARQAYFQAYQGAMQPVQPSAQLLPDEVSDAIRGGHGFLTPQEGSHAVSNILGILDAPRGLTENLIARTTGTAPIGRTIPPLGTPLSAEQGMEFGSGLTAEQIGNLAPEIRYPASLARVTDHLPGQWPSAGENVGPALALTATTLGRELAADPINYLGGMGLGLKAGRATLGRLVDTLAPSPKGPFTIPPQTLVQTPAEDAMRQSLMGEGRTGAPAGAPAPTNQEDIYHQLAQTTDDPLGLLSAIEKQPALKATPQTEWFKDSLRGRVLGIEPTPGLGVTAPEAESISAIATKEAEAVPTAKDVEGSAQIVATPKQVEVMPGMLSRIFNAGLDVVGQTGPKGQVLKHVLWDYMDRVERKTSEAVVNLDAQFSAITGRKSWAETKVARRLNPFKDYAMEQLYQITPAEKAQLVDFLDSGGTLLPTGPRAETIKQLGQAFFNATRQISEHEGVRQFTIPDPLGGPPKAYGSPNMFFPHVPNSDKLKDLQDLRIKQLYQSAKAGGKQVGTFDDYKTNLMRALDTLRNQEIQIGRFGWVGKSRGFDASQFGRPSEVLEAFGYDTDPVRAFFRFSSSGYRSGEAKLIQEPVNDLYAGIAKDLAKSSGSPNQGAWVRQVTDRVLGTEPLERADLEARGILSNLRHWNDTTLLQIAAIPQINQLTYIVGRAGVARVGTEAVKQTLGAALRRMRGEAPAGVDNIAERSGALFTNLLNEYTVPSTLSGRTSTAAMRSSGFTLMDAELRRFGAVIGGQYADDLAKIVVAHPTNKKALGILTELQLDPKAIIANKGLTPEMKDTAAQNFANMTSGRTDLRTLPLWLTTQDPTLQLFIQYKKFLFNNMIEFKRQLLNAPTVGTALGRTGRMLGTAAAMGELTRELQLGVSNFQNPFDLDAKKRVAAPLRGLYEKSPAAAYTIDRTLAGLGSVFGLLAYSAMESDRGQLYETIFGPTPGLAVSTVVNINKGITGAQQDKEDAWKALEKQYARRVPIIGPLGPAYVDQMHKNPYKGMGIKPLQPYQPFGVDEQ